MVIKPILFENTIISVDKSKNMFIASATESVILYDVNFNESLNINVSRGLEIVVNGEVSFINEKEYYLVNYNGVDYYILTSDLVDSRDEVVKEELLYVRTSLTFYENSSTIDVIGMIDKGSEISIVGHTEVLEDGSVLMYKVNYNNQEGYVYSKYLVDTLEESLLHYDEENNYLIHSKRTDTLLGGSGGNLDFYPREKVSFENNIMPSYVKSYYIPSPVLYNIDAYIEQALKDGINTFVVDIKDSTVPAYPAEAFKIYSPTNYEKAVNSYEEYQSAIKKIKDAGIYVVGRISVFKDSYYAIDHPENTIVDNNTGTSLVYNSSKWPTAFSREVWEYNVALAVESVNNMGFNEIQFDYVRFPDGTISKEKRGELNFQNTYGEDKAQAIQRFLMYAADELHKLNVYVSADVFGEAAHTYVTAYGQYWPAISNVVDVISAMPYPDHFGTYEYGYDVPVWTIPYQLLTTWGGFAYDRQMETPTPAVVRTWIQAYDAYKSPKVTYDSAMITQQLDALYESGLTGGFMPWNASGSLIRYTNLGDAFGKDY